MSKKAKPQSAMDRQVGGGHYKGMKIQHFTFCMVNNIPWGESAAIKYICRHQQKNKAEDLRKAIHYLEMCLEHYYGEETTTQPKKKAKSHARISHK